MFYQNLRFWSKKPNLIFEEQASFKEVGGRGIMLRITHVFPSVHGPSVEHVALVHDWLEQLVRAAGLRRQPNKSAQIRIKTIGYYTVGYTSKDFEDSNFRQPAWH